MKQQEEEEEENLDDYTNYAVPFPPKLVQKTFYVPVPQV
jgi:hypothetical protein